MESLIYKNNFQFYKEIYQIDKAKDQIYLPLKKNNIFEIKPLDNIEIFIDNTSSNIIDYLPNDFNNVIKLFLIINPEYITNDIIIEFDTRIFGYNSITKIRNLILSPNIINLYELLSFNNGKTWSFFNITSYDYSTNSSSIPNYINIGIKTPIIETCYISEDLKKLQISTSLFENSNQYFTDIHISTIYQIYEDEELTKLKQNIKVNNTNLNDYIFDISSFDTDKSYYIICKYIGKNFESKFSNPYEFKKSYSDFISTGDTSHDYFDSILDGPPVIKYFNNFTINSGHTVTTTNRCKGLYLYIMGDLIIDGTLSMTARGPNCPGQYIGIDPYNLNIELSDDNLATKYDNVIYPIGGLGVINGSSEGVNGACGSGGSCSSFIAGGNATSFSGGAGAGGYCYNSQGQKYYYSLSTPGNYGGAGGIGSPCTKVPTGGDGASGGGAGNPGGSSKFGGSSQSSSHLGSTGSSGTGGLIILIVKGNVIINGSIKSNGSNGGNGYLSSIRYYSNSKYWNTYTSGGSGSGGGAIHIFYKGKIIGSDKITANGGLGGSGNSYKGINGGNGSINLVQF